MILKQVDIIVDVRDAEEFEVSHIKGAINIPLFRLTRMPEVLTVDQYAVIGVYCGTGHRARIAYNYLSLEGLTVEDLGSISNYPDRLTTPKI